MSLIRDGRLVADEWIRLGDEEPLPETGNVIVSFARLAGLGNRIEGRNGRLGVAFPNTGDPHDLVPYLDRLALIALSFPAFTDGRAYSQAWILRSELGFRGELRATGEVLADQAAFMQRCGFDAFETSGRQPIETWRRAARSVTLAYQRGYGGEVTTRDRAKAADGRDETRQVRRGNSKQAGAVRLATQESAPPG